MWNYTYAIPSLMVLVVLLLYYFALPRIPIKMNRLFIGILGVESVVMFTDIMASYMDEEYTSFPLLLVFFVNALYFISFYSRGYLFYAFMSTLIKIDDKEDRWFKWVARLPYIICSFMAIASYYTGWVFSIDEKGYHSGPFYGILYYCFYFYLFLSLTTLILFWNNIKSFRDKLSIIGYNAILIVGIIVRMLLPKYLLMDTFCVMAIIVIYLSFENPDFYLENRSGVFNVEALRAYLDKNKGKNNYRLFGFVIRNYKDIREMYGMKQMSQGHRLIEKYILKTFPDCKCFYCRSGRYVMLGNKDMDFEIVHKTLKERFLEPWTDEDAEAYFGAGFVEVDADANKLEPEILLSGIVDALSKLSSVETDTVHHLTGKELGERAKENEVKRALEYAIEHDEVEVFLQPIMDSKNGKIAGAESLARIRDKEGKLIPPGIFIPVAESNGRINELGMQVFEKSCKFIKENDLAKHGIYWLNVNLSPIQFMNPKLADVYFDTVKRYGLDSDMIHLEITEESMVDDVFFKEQIERMKEHGFKFVLDDYGTGYSNLVMLKKCPFICIKLDMSLVWDYCKAPDDILPTMIQAFKHMNFEVTSEGIEDENMAGLMKDVGCEYLQGYYYSKPVTMDEFVKMYLS